MRRLRSTLQGGGSTLAVCCTCPIIKQRLQGQCDVGLAASSFPQGERRCLPSSQEDKPQWMCRFIGFPGGDQGSSSSLFVICASVNAFQPLVCVQAPATRKNGGRGHMQTHPSVHLCPFFVAILVLLSMCRVLFPGLLRDCWGIWPPPASMAMARSR